MPKKPNASEAQESTAPAVDPQKQYLMDQFGNLMEQVGDGFGGPLQEELISRLEQTIADFHDEVNEMLGRLKDNSEKRHERLKEIWNNPEGSAESSSEDDKPRQPTISPITVLRRSELTSPPCLNATSEYFLSPENTDSDAWPPFTSIISEITTPYLTLIMWSSVA